MSLLDSDVWTGRCSTGEWVDAERWAAEPELGTAFPDDPRVGMLSLTGSTPAGKQLSEAAGRNLVKMVAELCGNNPFVVLEGADVAKAAPARAFASFTHQGQICMATGRRWLTFHEDQVGP